MLRVGKWSENVSLLWPISRTVQIKVFLPVKLIPALKPDWFPCVIVLPFSLPGIYQRRKYVLTITIIKGFTNYENC